MKYKTYFLFVLAMLALSGLTGCKPLREDIADLLSPPTDAQMAGRMADMTAAGKRAEAIETGEKFLLARPGPHAQVHAKLVQLYLDQGDAVKALVHMQGGNEAQTSAEVAPAPAAPAEPLAPAAASAKVGPDGVEASAGNAKASIK